MVTWSPADYDVLVAQARATVPPIDPSEVAIVLYEESGLDPANPGPPGAAPQNQVAGLNQMSTPNLESLGLTRDAWLAMTPAQQLPWIFRFWRALAQTFNRGRFPSDGGELLALNFLPGAFENASAGDNPNAVIAGSAGPYAWAYNDNPPLQNASGAITVNTLRTYVANIALRAGLAWQQVIAQIRAAGERAGAIDPTTTPTPPDGTRGGGGGIVALLLLTGAAIYYATRSA